MNFRPELCLFPWKNCEPIPRRIQLRRAKNSAFLGALEAADDDFIDKRFSDPVAIERSISRSGVMIGIAIVGCNYCIAQQLANGTIIFPYGAGIPFNRDNPDPRFFLHNIMRCADVSTTLIPVFEKCMRDVVRSL